MVLFSRFFAGSKISPAGVNSAGPGGRCPRDTDQSTTVLGRPCRGAFLAHFGFFLAHLRRKPRAKNAPKNDVWSNNRAFFAPFLRLCHICAENEWADIGTCMARFTRAKNVPFLRRMLGAKMAQKWHRHGSETAHFWHTWKHSWDTTCASICIQGTSKMICVLFTEQTLKP